MAEAKGMTIGRLAQAAGVGVETIRFYQREGLIAEPPRPAVGYRQYAAEVVDRLHFIQRAKTLGFTLAEIRELLELGDGCCGRSQQLAERKLALVQAKQRDLAAMAEALESALAACAANVADAACPLVQSLSGDSATEPKEGS
jgi:MerR family mercuric resistance operon transcriptional regulator